MKKNITKGEEKALLEIAKRLMAAVDSRGDLEARDNDSEDFIEVPVWGIQKAMEEAYLLGRITDKPTSPDTAPHRGLCHGWQNDPNEPTAPQTGADVTAWMRQEGKAHGRTDDGYHHGNLQPHG